MATGTSKYLYLMAEADIPTGEKHEKGEPKPTRRVGPGLLSKLELSQKEIDSLPRGVIRKATVEEIEAAENAEPAADPNARAEREALLAEQEREIEALQGKLSAEKADAEQGGKLRTDAQRTKFEAAQSKQIDTLTAKHQKALAALEA